MKLSTKSEYAFLALIECASVYPDGGRVKMQDIARVRNIPKKYLEHILYQLKRGGYIQTKRGASGGICLSRAPEEISLAEIVRLMDGALAPTLSVSTYFYESTPLEQSPEFIAFFKGIRDYLAGQLENTTLADLLPDRGGTGSS